MEGKKLGNLARARLSNFYRRPETAGANENPIETNRSGKTDKKPRGTRASPAVSFRVLSARDSAPERDDRLN